jgi:dinuclear metal center YbgI/SA1388 family protein
MYLSEIIEILEKWAAPAYQESYDNSGLITGNLNQKISKALVCLDSTEEVLDEAINKGCNLIIAHHPIVFSGIKKITGRNYVERVLIKAIKNDIAIYAIHTNLDNIPTGVNKKIADLLGLKKQEILSHQKNGLRKLYTFCPESKADEVRMALFNAGAGNIGNYDSCSYNTSGFGTFRGLEGTSPFVGEKGKLHKENEIKMEVIFPNYIEKRVISALIEAHPYEEVAYDVISLENQNNNIGAGITGELSHETEILQFLNTVKKTFNTACIRYTRINKPKVKRIAVCGGSGSFLLNNAIAANTDVFITSDYKYHQFFDAENKIIIADIGHYESEQFTKELIKEQLNQKIPTFAVLLSEINTNPINYLV